MVGVINKPNNEGQTSEHDVFIQTSEQDIFTQTSDQDVFIVRDVSMFTPSEQIVFIKTFVKQYFDREGYSNHFFKDVWNIAGISEEEAAWALQFV